MKRSHLLIITALSAALSVTASADTQKRPLPSAQPPATMKQAPLNPRPGKPDITSKHGITIGGKFSAWGGAIMLTEADSFLQSNGKCAFNVSYDEVNIGPVATAPAFANRLRSGATLVSQQTGQHLNAGESKTINTQAYLAPGDQVVSLMLDDGNAVAESNEGNNLFRVKVSLKGRCAGLPLTQGQPDLVPILTNPMTGKVAVKNIGAAAAGASKLAIKCSKVGHVGGGGGCPESPGLAAYADAAVPDAAVVNVPPLAPGATYVHHLAFWPGLVFPKGTYKFVAKADATSVVAESNEANNVVSSSLVK